MPKIEPPHLSGDKFVFIGFLDELRFRNGDYFEIASGPIIQPFDNDYLWRVPARQWLVDDAVQLDRSQYQYVNTLTGSQYVIIRENQFPFFVGAEWLRMLRVVSPELADEFSSWATELNADYEFRYRLGTYYEHAEFNTALAERLERILITALTARDDRMSALAYHLYEDASQQSSIPPAHSFVVRGAFVSILHHEELPALEKMAKRDKVYRNHRKFIHALSTYQSAKGLAGA